MDCALTAPPSPTSASSAREYRDALDRVSRPAAGRGVTGADSVSVASSLRPVSHLKLSILPPIIHYYSILTSVDVK